MKRTIIAGTADVLLSLATLAARHLWRPLAIVASLRQLPEVASIELTGPAAATMTLITGAQRAR